MSKTKEFAAKRKFDLRRDASVATGRRQIAGVFGLSEGSVRLPLPDGSRATSVRYSQIVIPTAVSAAHTQRTFRDYLPWDYIATT
jgi:hypothetical protein